MVCDIRLSDTVFNIRISDTVCDIRVSHMVCDIRVAHMSVTLRLLTLLGLWLVFGLGVRVGSGRRLLKFNQNFSNFGSDVNTKVLWQVLMTRFFAHDTRKFH